MLARLLRLVLIRYAGGPVQAAVYLGLLSFLRKRLAKDEVIEVQGLRPGDRYVVEHLEISHKQQIRQLKREERAARKAQEADEAQQAQRARDEAAAGGRRRARARKARRQPAS